MGRKLKPSKTHKTNVRAASVDESTTSESEISQDRSSRQQKRVSQETQGASSGLEAIKEWYFLSLLVCFVGVIGLYSGYAYLQESLLADKEKKMNTNFVLLVMNAIAIALSSTIIKVFGMGNLLDQFQSGDAIVGTLNFFTMFCSNFALRYVSYPFVVLSKSAKILPVCLTGWLTGVYKLTWAQVCLAMTITAGLVIFNSNKVKNVSGDESVVGLALVFASLMFDGFVGTATDKNHKTQKRPFAYHSMLYTNLVGLVGNAIFYLYARRVNNDDTYERVMADKSLFQNVVMISLCGAVGQIFIYLTISLHDCYKLSIITTSRKCISVVLSAILFKHEFSNMQWLGASMVLGGTCVEAYLGAKRKQREALEKAQAAKKKQ